ncbi:MAG TPA: hypothetical protein VM840_11580 [Actinomycetota bacterium]|nr:hypothetical protein [Actinomycetota bacterium]
MRRATIGLLVLSLLGLGACGERDRPEQRLRAALSRTEKESKLFTYVEQVDYQPPRKERPNRPARHEVPAQRNEVRGSFEDDMRYSVVYRAGENDIAEGVVSDDALAVRVINIQAAVANNRTAFERLGVLQSTAEDTDAIKALLEGRWVVDYTAAPPLAAIVNREGVLDVGSNPAQDAIYAFQYFLRSIEESAGVIEFNPDAIGYNPADDPWSADADADLRAKGIIRFDIIPPPLPRRGGQGSVSEEPGTSHFRKMAFYVRGNRVLKVVEKIDIEGQRDFRRILDLDRGSDYHREMLRNAQEGGTRDLVRERTMSYEVSRAGEPVTVEMPIGDAVVGTIGRLLGGGDEAAASPFSAPRGKDAPADEEEAGPDTDAKNSLRDALAAAKTLYTDTNDYRVATPERLKEELPELDFVSDGPSDGPTKIGVRTPSPDEIVMVAFSPSGRCFAIREDNSVQGKGITFANKAADANMCRVAEFTGGNFSATGWD